MLANYLFMEPRNVLSTSVKDIGGVISFLFSCGLIILAVDTLRRAVVDLEAAKDRETKLNAELRHFNDEFQHRVKNTLTVVQALASQTFRGVPGCDEVVLRFHGRLQALAAGHSVLTSGNWETCELPELAIRATAPFNAHGAVRFAGPSCSLPDGSCVPLVLALHELGTNALKYGALSTPHGVVEVHWQVREADGSEADNELVLDWTEAGGPPVEMPKRRGLGSRLVVAQTGIEGATMDFRPEGLTSRIVVKGAVLLPGERG
jgi:two-component sensor histidine kinase